MTTPSVVHVVLVRWKPDADAAALQELTELASAFPDTIPGVLAVHCGANTSPEGLAGGFEWALIVSFASSAARDDYLPHPAHQPVAQLISRFAEQVVVFDVDA
ncbi:Dabb family protein [Microbacterium sp. DT81.1]|uniref:Dabb family protein n=1 Tax=Microbacterium sp. DT81.1 TaxID=3393413 RepID=UPI003CE6D4E0